VIPNRIVYAPSAKTIAAMKRWPVSRRRFTALLGGAVAAVRPFTAHAQKGTVPVVGFLAAYTPSPNSSIHQGMRELGYVDGQNMTWVSRFAERHYDQLSALAADLASRHPDVIITDGGTPVALAAKGATSSIPIVFVSVADPVGAGLVASLARPGGNVTGFSNYQGLVVAKAMDLVCDLVPRADNIGFLGTLNNPGTSSIVRTLQQAATAKRVALTLQNASNEAEIDTAFDAFRQPRVDALIVEEDVLLNSQARRRQIVALAAREAIPAAYMNTAFTSDGGLIAYGVDKDELERQAGVYAGRILKGAKPADLPVQQPTKFKLAVNLRTARALGLTVPRLILERADQVIE
jgi:putative ABC transport system substrate-binding protein